MERNITYDDTSTEPATTYRYRVKAIANNLGESDYSNIIMFFTQASALKAPFLNEQTVQIFPNPNNGQFTVSVNNDLQGSLNMQIIDVTGKQMTPPLFFDKTIQLFIHSFQLNDLPNGTYFLKIVQDKHLAWFSLNVMK